MRTDFTDRTVLVSGKPPLLRRPDFWSKLLLEAMDSFCYAALFVAGEVQSWALLTAIGISAIRIITRFRFATLWMFIGFLILLFVGVILSLRLQFHPLVSAAHVAPIALAWIGLARGSEDFWGWRMGLGFISLILASALSPDFSVTLFIILFIVSGSVGISCRYLDQEFIRRGVIGTLPRGFIQSSFFQTVILFIAALLIFPLIPRVQGRAGSGFGNEPGKTGYTEDVSLSEWSRVSSSGSSAPALRIYGPDGTDPSIYIPAGLIRTRVLNILSENRWDPAPVRFDSKVDESTDRTKGTLRIVREMIGPANIPVPYGALSTSIELHGYRWRAEKTLTGEWREARSRNQRYTYLVSVGSSEDWRPQDRPTAIDLRVPERFQSIRMKTLATKLFKNLKDPTAKIRAVQGHFMSAGFSAASAEDAPPLKANTEESALPPIERFLFVEKNGHCELFSSSMAILLRMGGVPTRLIAGFRVTRNAMGDVLTVRQSDAHAWVEAYIAGVGWRPFDPTPKILHTLAVADWLRDGYDWASAKWSQYILNYGEGENSIGAQWDAAKKVAASIATGKNPFKMNPGDTEVNSYLFLVIFSVVSLGLAASTVSIMRAIRKNLSRRRESSWIRRLVRERNQVERMVERAKSGKRNPVSGFEEWFKLYEEARFNSVSADRHPEVLENLRKRKNAIVLSMKNVT